jgi:hypothetical protein
MMLPRRRGGPLMRHQAFLREQGERCLSLADEARELEIAEELRTIGNAFRDKAEELEKEKSRPE